MNTVRPHHSQIEECKAWDEAAAAFAAEQPKPGHDADVQGDAEPDADDIIKDEPEVKHKKHK